MTDYDKIVGFIKRRFIFIIITIIVLWIADNMFRDIDRTNASFKAFDRRLEESNRQTREKNEEYRKNMGR